MAAPSPAPLLAPLADGLWSTEHDLFMPGGLHFRGRMLVVRLADGGLLLHSPVPVDDALAAALAELGPVRVLVAPNNLHHLHLGPVQARYPDAVTWAAPGLGAKRPELTIDHVLGVGTPPWASELEPHFIAGIPWMDETVFFHRPTGTLVVTDLFFHIHGAELANLRSRFFFWIYGVLDRPRQSPIVRLQAKDRAAAGRSAQALLGLPVQRLVPAHGRVVEDRAAAVLREVLATQLSWAPAALEVQSA
jgi:hypothetical protein